MKLVLVCAILSVVPLSSANASFRPQPSRLPAPSSSAPSEIGRGGWDTRPRDKWDRALRHCLNDRRQNRRERRVCADQGMPVKAGA